MQKTKNENYRRLLHRRSKTFHCLPTRPQSQQQGERDFLTETEMESLSNKKRSRPQTCRVSSGTRGRPRPVTSSILRRESDPKHRRSVVFINGNGLPLEQERNVFNYYERTPSRTSSASSKRSITRSLTNTPSAELESGRSSRSNSKPTLPRVPGLIRLTSFSGLEDFDELEQECDNLKERKSMVSAKIK